MSTSVNHLIDVANQSHRMGFKEMAAGMAAICALEMRDQFSDVLKVAPCQAGTPRGDGSAAVGQSEVLAAGVGKPFPMNTTTASAPVHTGIFARKVSEITGLSERELERYHPNYFGSPGHWKFISEAGGGMLYTPKGLLALLEGLRLAERKAEAQFIAAAIHAGGLEVKAPEPTPITELPPVSYAPPPRSRLLEWEELHG